MSNLTLYDKLRSVPAEAQKTITGGRLNGKTDINPMWRIKALTEAFGSCGIGWWYEITDKRLESTPLGEVSAFVDINLYYVLDGQVSKPVVGTGGSAFVAKEKNGLYQSDECFKMALTDAISVACKALGVGADVYWDKDTTKYTRPQAEPAQKPVPRASMIADTMTKYGLDEETFKTVCTRLRGKGAYVDKAMKDMSQQEFAAALDDIERDIVRLGGGA